MSSTATLKDQHEAAKEALKDARFAAKNGTGTDEAVKEAKREADRLSAAVRRENKNGSGKGKVAEKIGSKASAKKDAEPQTPRREGKGVVASRKNRETKTVISLVDGRAGKGNPKLLAEFDLDPANGKYALICEDHGTVRQCTSFAEAAKLARTPTEWCTKCKRAA